MTRLALDYLSPTQLGRLQACEQRYTFTYLDGEREPGTEQTATGIGFAEAVEFGVNVGIEAYRDARPPVDELWDDVEVRENERLVAEATIRHAVTGYDARYYLADHGVEREVEYIVQTLPGKRGEPTPVLYVRVDGAGLDYLVEDKLRSGSSLQAAKVDAEVARGHQRTAEVYVHWRKTGVLLPVRYRLIRKPDRTKTKAMKLDAEAIESYVAEWFGTNPKAFDEREVTRTVEDMARFERELRRLWVTRGDLLAGKQPVRNPEACFSFGRVCPFAEKCSSNNGDI